MEKTFKILIFLICSLLFVNNSCSQNKNVEKVGDITQIIVPISALATTLILKDKKGTWQFAKSFGATIIVTRVLKEVIHKERPGNPWSFDSFPSGHTSAAFSGASFIQRRYGWKYGIPAYIFATYTGFSRVHAKKHDSIDVLAGAVIGIGNTYIFTTPYQQEHYQLTLGKQNDSYLIGFTYKF